MGTKERGSSDVIFILVVVLLAIIVIIMWLNISQGTPFGERLILLFGSIWTGILAFFQAIFSRF